jgi:hypothetical protein
MTEEEKPRKIFTGAFKVAPDQLEAKPGEPSKTSMAIVAAMIEAAEDAAQKKLPEKK